MKTINNAFYGDSMRWFVGVVEETGTDEPKLGRVRVRIHGVHGDQSDINTSDLPLAQVMVPATEPGVSGLGKHPNLHIGATVVGFFLDGAASQLPLIVGSIPKIESPSNEQLYNVRTDESYQDSLYRGTGKNVFGTPGSNGNAPSIESVLAYGLDSLELNGDESYTQIAFDYFTRTERYSSIQIAAILGNLLIESGPGDIQSDISDNDKFGIAGWSINSSRIDKLYSYAEAYNRIASDLFVQLSYIDWELSNIAFFKGAEFREKKNLTEATYFFHSNYIRPKFVNEEGTSINNTDLPNSSSAVVSNVDNTALKKNSEKEALIEASKIYNNFIRKPVVNN